MDYITVNRNYQKRLKGINSNWVSGCYHLLHSEKELKKYKTQAFRALNCDTSKPHFPEFDLKNNNRVLSTRYRNTDSTKANLEAALRSWGNNRFDVLITRPLSIIISREFLNVYITPYFVDDMYKLLQLQPTVNKQLNRGLYYVSRNSQTITYLSRIPTNCDIQEVPNVYTDSISFVEYKQSTCYICNSPFKMYYKWANFHLEYSEVGNMTHQYDVELFNLVMCNKCFAAENLLPSRI